MKRVIKHVTDGMRVVRQRIDSSINDWQALIADHRYQGDANGFREEFADIEGLRTSDPVYYAGCMPTLARGVESIDMEFVLRAVPMAYTDEDRRSFQRILNSPLFISDSYVYLACLDYTQDDPEDIPNLYIRRSPLPVRDAHSTHEITAIKQKITAFATACLEHYSDTFPVNTAGNHTLSEIIFDTVVLHYFRIVEQFRIYFPAFPAYLTTHPWSQEQREAIVSIGLGSLFRLETPNYVSGFDTNPYLYHDNNNQIFTVYADIGYCMAHVTTNTGPLARNALLTTIDVWPTAEPIAIITIASGLCQLLQDFEQATAHNIINEEGLVTTYYNIQLADGVFINWNNLHAQTETLAGFLLPLPDGDARIHNISGSLVYHRGRYSVVFCYITLSGFIATLIKHAEGPTIIENYYRNIMDAIHNNTATWDAVASSESGHEDTINTRTTSTPTSRSHSTSSSASTPVPSLVRALHNAQIQVQTRSLQQLFIDEEVPDLRTPSPLSPETLRLIYSPPRQYEEVPDRRSPSPRSSPGGRRQSTHSRSSSGGSRLSRPSYDSNDQSLLSEERDPQTPQSWHGNRRAPSIAPSWTSSSDSSTTPPLIRSNSALFSQHPSLAQLTRSLDRVLSSISE